MKIPTTTLSNGAVIPMLGFGCWQGLGFTERMTPEENYRLTKQMVKDAIEAGYRNFDTANGYQNEDAVGDAIQESGLARKDVFIATKFSTREEVDAAEAYRLTKAAIENALKCLRTDYIDLYFIHSPVTHRMVMYKAIEEAFDEGKIRSLGVSMFFPRQLDQLVENCRIKPVINQIEYHPYWIHQEMVKNSLDHGLAIEAFSPLMQAQVLLQDTVIAGIAEKHGKTAAQVILRWDFQKGVITIPKSSNVKRIRENMEILDFELSAEEIHAIDALSVKNLSFNPKRAEVENIP
jgi:diketogulonate reductase-like aldo/keto reductase